MDTPTSFPRFGELPYELRLQIWACAHPSRVLQLGIALGVPFPFLVEAPPARIRVKGFTPINTSIPSLFHTCHESRELCLTTYIPFAYTYLHPHFDVLYISKQAGAFMFENMVGLGGRAMPGLYPIACLERVAVEFDFEDLPERARREGGGIRNAEGAMEVSQVMDYYVQTFARFGPPKELLVVRGADGVYSQHSMSITGWKSLQLIQGIQNVDLPDWAEKRLLEYVEGFFGILKATNQWLHWRMPELKIVGIKKKGEIVVWKKYEATAMQKGKRLAKEWKVETAALAGWRVSWDPFTMANTAAALERAGIVSNGSRNLPDISSSTKSRG